MLTAEWVNSLLTDCLFTADEMVDGKPVVDPVVAEGVMLRVGFHPGRLVAAEGDIRALLAELSSDFFPAGGGGHSFLALCQDKYGSQWGEHRDCDALLCLAIGIGAARFLFPRDVWTMLPGGMPYLVIEP